MVIESLLSLVDATPYDARLHVRVADCFEKSAPDTKTARANVIAFIRRNPDVVGLQLVFALLCERAGNRDRAEFLRNSVLAVRPGGPPVLCAEGIGEPDGSGNHALTPTGPAPWTVNLIPGRNYLLAPVPQRDPRTDTTDFKAYPVVFLHQRDNTFYFRPSPTPDAIDRAERLTRAVRGTFEWAGALRNRFGGSLEPQTVGGMVFGVRLPWLMWRTHAAALLEAHPIRRVEFTDQPPDDIDLAHQWPQVEFAFPARREVQRT